MNKENLKEWIIEKLDTIHKKSEIVTTVAEVIKLNGEREVLEQLMEDFNLVEVEVHKK